MNNGHSRGAKPWDFYSGSNLSPSQTEPAVSDKESPWNGFGTSMNAISFGFVATAILISMFLIMAVFEHLLGPRSGLDPGLDGEEGSLESGTIGNRMHSEEKPDNPHTVAMSYSSEFSVMMPGQHYPTFIAQPAPLACPRDGIVWPCHQNGISSLAHT